MLTDTQRSGLLINSEQPINFSYIGANGAERQYSGFAGDSLASALLANGVLLTANHFVSVAGSELGYAPEFRVREFNALAGNSVCARQLPIYPGLRASSANTSSGSESLSNPVAELDDAAGSALEQRARNMFSDVAVIGGGLHGLLAARRLIRLGLRVCIIEQKPRLGLSRLARGLINGEQSYEIWLADTLREFESSDRCQLLTHCAALGFDQGQLLAYQSRARRQNILWRLRVRAALVATGASELALAHIPDKACPGIMLASHVDQYWRYQGVLAGSRVVFAGNNSSIYQTAIQIQAAGAQVWVADERESIDAELSERLHVAGIKLLLQHKVIEIKASKERLHQVVTCPVNSRVGRQFIKCDTLATSGGWIANAQLAQQARSAELICRNIGTAAGDWSPLPQALVNSLKSSEELAEKLLGKAQAASKKQKSDLNTSWQNYWPGAQPAEPQPNADDFDANLLAASVPVAALAQNAAYKPVMRSALHDWHNQVGAQIQYQDGWLEVLCYPQLTESLAAATLREAQQSAFNVGIHDASAQGMIAITGNNPTKFITSLVGKQIGTNACCLLPLLRDDGSVLDWCQLWCLNEREYLLTTHPQRYQAVWARLRQLGKRSQIILTDVCHKWSIINITGANSSRLLAVVTGIDDLDITASSCQSVRIFQDADIHCARVNLANDADYLVLVDPSLAQPFWRLCLESGNKAGICAFGKKARQLLHLEHGYGHLQLATATDYQAPRQLADYRLGSEDASSSGPQLLHFLLRGEAEVGELLMAADAVVGSLACVADSSCGTKILALGWAEASCLTADELSVLRSDGSRIDARALLTGFADEQ